LGPRQRTCAADRLAERVRATIGEDRLSGHYFLFRSRRGDRLKILAWDRDAFVLWYKRLEAGVFKLPRMTLVLLLFLGKPGALPPTEVISAHKAGADFVKVFPCVPAVSSFVSG
jgi:hypothetical protein